MKFNAFCFLATPLFCPAGKDSAQKQHLHMPQNVSFTLNVKVAYFSCNVRIMDASLVITGFSSSTVTNPLWLVKTRLQLDRASGNKTLTVRKCVSNIYSKLVSPLN